MSHFYGNMQGSRGETTRQGGKNSGIYAHVRGWNFGVQVSGYVNDEGEDTFKIYLTSGSNGRRGTTFLGTFTAKDLKD